MKVSYESSAFEDSISAETTWIGKVNSILRKFHFQKSLQTYTGSRNEHEVKDVAWIVCWYERFWSSIIWSSMIWSSDLCKKQLFTNEHWADWRYVHVWSNIMSNPFIMWTFKNVVTLIGIFLSIMQHRGMFERVSEMERARAAFVYRKENPESRKGP